MVASRLALNGALVYAAKNGNLTGEQFKRLRGELEAAFQGARVHAEHGSAMTLRHDAGRPMLLEGGLDWKPLSLSPKDMDFIAAKHAAARDRRRCSPARGFRSVARDLALQPLRAPPMLDMQPWDRLRGLEYNSKAKGSGVSYRAPDRAGCAKDSRRVETRECDEG